MQKKLEITQPDDWHIHFRDGALLAPVAAASAEHFARGIIMPNLVPPVVSLSDAEDYHAKIIDALASSGSQAFEPLMTLYLTEATDPSEIDAAVESGLVKAVKLYPAGATTNSSSGVTNIDRVMPVLERMALHQLPLCVHGEVTDHDIDIFDREAVFIDRVLAPLQAKLPELRIIFEHVTTSDGVDYVSTGSDNIAATITPHHLMINRNHLLVGGIKPHYYCLPVAKREHHRLALRKAVTSDNPRFFLGTDSAPHLDGDKESACGCAGVFNSPNTLACLAHVFEEENALDRLEAFCSLNGPAFYRLPINEQKLQLIKQDQPVTWPEKLTTSAGDVTIFNPGVDIFWRVAPA